MKATPSLADLKIRMIEQSIRCMVFGFLGLLPFIGPSFAIIAGWYSGQARHQEKYQWNPGRKLRLIGLGCAVTGVLLWSFVDILLLWKIWNVVTNSPWP